MHLPKLFILLISSLFLLILSNRCSNPIYAQNDAGNLANQIQAELLEGKVVQILEEKEIIPAGLDQSQLYQKMDILITKGSLKEQNITVVSGDLPMANLPKYKIGDQLVIYYSQDLNGNPYFYISDYVRRDALLFLLIIFIVLVIAVAGFQGLSSILGMALSFLVIFKFILPQIYAGVNPVQVSVFGSLLIIPATFFLSHGFNRKTIIAISGTLIALFITAILTLIFVNVSKLSGFASEEAGFLQAYNPGLINIKSLLIAGIIIGVLGVLDDITISQAAIVAQLKDANPKLKMPQLYAKAMSVGKDHIASMVNTLILVYTGAALPLLLIFINNPRPFSEIINYEIIADEIVRTLVGSIGLILAVPITTLLATFFTSTYSPERKSI